MTILKDPIVRDYLQPVSYAIETNIRGLIGRMERRSVSDWKVSDFMMTAAEAKQLADDCEWIVDALEIIKDAKAGAFDAEDREGGTPG